MTTIMAAAGAVEWAAGTGRIGAGSGLITEEEDPRAASEAMAAGSGPGGEEEDGGTDSAGGGGTTFDIFVQFCQT